MENDSAQHATMAMQMAKSNDYLALLKGNAPYLDKPHMHFWLSAFSFEVFGFEVWAYRLPALLLTIFAGYGIFKLANLLYQNLDIARLAAFMFMTAQSIILSLHDVRTDAVLTAFSVLAIWQWTKFLKKNELMAAILGGIFTAFAYSTKGIIAIAVIGLFLFLMVVYKHYWKRLWNWKLGIGILSFVIGSLPMLYAYYHQFGILGVEFITYGQATGRFSGEDFGGASQDDYFFYFHTLLWAFLPWSLWFYYGLFLKGKEALNKKKMIEISSIVTALIFMLAMNFSSFKLPHYLNIVIPLVSIFTAAVAVEFFQKYRTNIPKAFQIMQYIMVAIGVLALGFLATIAFKLEEIPVIFVLLFSLILIVILFLKSSSRIERTVVVSAGFILFTNIYLNSTFYKQLLNYQSGYKLGLVAQQQHIEPKDIYMIDGQYSWAMDWAIGGTTQKTDKIGLNQLNEPFWVMLYNQNPNDLTANKFKIVKSYRADHYRITRLKWEFINPLSRAETLQEVWLVQYAKK